MSLSKCDRILTYVQVGSGLAFSTFSVLHLLGHLSTSISFDTAELAMYVFREYYRNPVVEPIVVGLSLVAHIGSSIARMAIRSSREQAMDKRRKEKLAAAGKANEINQVGKRVSNDAVRALDWHRASGYVLMAIVTSHVLATRVAPMQAFDDPSIVNLTWLTHGLQSTTGFFFYPYYFIFGTSGVYHTLYGISQSLGMLGVIPPHRRVKAKRWSVVMGVAAGLTLSGVLALGGLYETIPIPLRAKWAVLDEAVINMYKFWK
ncbi:hypothetical protein DFS34DRAFT_602950 [Phlyctochytrium arcticum]|nr:hypothetical protein DFS34DRAFT_602950 [Phlyctochytrium arcticum]